MWLNLLALTEKVFFYSAASFALHDLIGSWRLAAGTAGTFVLGIEILQRYQTAHVPEITDTLLVLLACATGAALSQDKTGGQPERDYGVVLTDDLAIDKAETEALPSKNTGQRNAAP